MSAPKTDLPQLRKIADELARSDEASGTVVRGAAAEIERLRQEIAAMSAHDMRETLRGRRPV